MSVPQSAPALGQNAQPAPLRRKFSGHDEKVTNLMKMFPDVPEDAIRQELSQLGGHASKARNAIQKKYGGPPATPSGEGAVTPPATPSASPQPVTKEPEAPAPAPPSSAPALMEKPPPRTKPTAPKAAAKPPQPTAAEGSKRGVQAAPASKADTSKAAGGKRGVTAAPGKADTGKIDTFLASLSKPELKKVLGDVEKVLGVAPSAAKAEVAAAPRGRSVEKKEQGASCFKMFTHVCAADGAKGVKAQMRSDAMGR